MNRIKPQRLCSSEHSSPQSERRKDEIISSNHTNNGEPSSFLNVTTATNINEKMNSNVPLMTYELNPVNGDHGKEKLVHSNNLKEKRSFSEDCNVSEFAQVSDDMNELVYHLNSIQNDISELSGKSISLSCENKT